MDYTVDYERVFNILPYPSLIIDKLTYQILKVNTSFSEKVMPSEMALKLSFLLDILSNNDQSIFLSAIELFKNVNKTSVEAANVKTLTLERLERFPAVRNFDWTISKLDENSFFLVGKQVCDIPERISDRESELIDYFQKAPIALHWLSGTGHVIWANNTELESLGYAADEYIGHSILEFCPEEEVAVQEVFRKLSNKETIHNAPFKFRTKSGAVKYLMVDSNVSFHPDGSFNHTRCFIRDDTERRIREAIQQAEMNQIRLAAEAKDRFIRKLFHEIRTPMHIISSSFSSGAIQSYSQDEMLELSRITDDCLGLIEDLTFATMFEAGNVFVPNSIAINVEKSLTEIIHNVKASLLPDISKDILVSLNIHDDMPKDILSDKYLVRAMYNLLKNCCVSYQNSILNNFPLGGCTISISIAPSANSIVSTKSIDDLSLSSAYNDFTQVLRRQKRKLDDSNFCFTLLFRTEKGSSTLSPFNSYDINRSFQHYYSEDLPDKIEKTNGSFHNKLTNIIDSINLKPTSASMGSGGLGLGWFVSYNVIQNLGGVLDCDVSDDSSSFRFKISVDTVTSMNKSEQVKSKMRQSRDDLLGLNHNLNIYPPKCLQVPMSESSLAASHLIADIAIPIESSSVDAVTTLSCKENTKIGKNGRVLIVDDSPICQKVMVKSLEKCNYETEVASNGQEACEKLDHEPCLFDAVLMDLRMPIMDGISATKICKQKRHLANIPIIIVTAEVGDDIRVAATDAGAAYFINKPARMNEINDVLCRALSL